MAFDRDEDHGRRDPRERPADPAGTRPKHDPGGLLPSRPLEGAVPGADDARDQVVDGSAVEEGEAPPLAAGGDLLPERRQAGGGLGAVRAAHVPPPHAPRFHFLYGALAALAVAVVAAGTYALLEGGSARDRDAAARADWSPWHPSQTSIAGAGEIASHVGRQYRLADGRQIVNVEASELSVGATPLTVAIRQTPDQGGDIQVFGDSGVMYRLCGLGKDCSIPFGKKSGERALLLRREALELALYSFRYLDGADQVVVLMAPPPGQKPSLAVFFRRGDLARQLQRPLHAYLAARTPTVTSIRASADSPFVERLTTVHTFTFSLIPANTENRGFLVLDPVQVTTAPAAGTSSSTGASASAKKKSSSK